MACIYGISMVSFLANLSQIVRLLRQLLSAKIVNTLSVEMGGNGKVMG